jgi:uncharacterized protein
VYVVFAYDYPGAEAGEHRQRLLHAHLAHVEKVMERILVAGPLSDETGNAVGSLLLLDVPDEAAARAFMAADPYASAPIWERLEIRGYRAAAGRWVGGAAWKR